jgi:cbb3-type cytochrome oxidase cytochrome c subunit
MKLLLAALFLVSVIGTGIVLAQDAPATARGRQQFFDQGCYGCHIIGKVGTPIGPDLSHIGAHYSSAYLARWLRDPESQRPSAHMPRLELTEEQVAALAAYLSSLR